MARVTAKELALMVASTLTVLIAAEVGLRAFQYLRDGTDPLTLLPGDRQSVFPRSPFLPFGPRVGWRFERAGNPAWTQFNDLGLRMPGSLPEREPGEVRILALGGSTTENVWNELGIHWPLAFECLARRDGRDDLRMLNAGMSAYSSAHSLVRYQLDLVETNPDVVLIMHNINDLTVSYHAALADTVVDPSYLVKYGKKGYTGQVDGSDVVLSRLASLVRSRLLRTSSSPQALPEPSMYDLSAGARFFRRNLVSLVRAVEASGAVPVLLTMPRSRDPAWVELGRQGDMDTAGLGRLPEAVDFFSDFDRFNDVIRGVAGDRGVPLIDMAGALVEGPDTFVDVVHYSTEGVRSFASTLYAAADSFLPASRGEHIRHGLAPCEGVLSSG